MGGTAAADGSADFAERGPSSSRRPTRFFFTALGLAFILIATLGFAPHMLAFFGGTFKIPPIAHVHGAIMSSWLLMFVLQARFAALGRMDLHRRVGGAAIWLGVVVWFVLIGITLRDYFAQPYPMNENIFYSLPQLYIIVAFAPLLVGAWRMRNKPKWHKRLMAVATICLLQAAVDRLAFLPFHAPVYWPQIACLDLLLIPMVAYDFATDRQLHRGTVVACGWLIAVQVGVLILWPSAWWHAASDTTANFLT